MHIFPKNKLYQALFIPILSVAGMLLPAADEQPNTPKPSLNLKRCLKIAYCPTGELVSPLPSDPGSRKEFVCRIVRSFSKEPAFCRDAKFAPRIDKKLTALCKATGCAFWDIIGGDDKKAELTNLSWMQHLFSLRKKAFLDAAQAGHDGNMRKVYFLRLYSHDVEDIKGCANMMEECLLSAPDTTCYWMTAPGCTSSSGCAKAHCTHKNAFDQYLNMRLHCYRDQKPSIGRLPEVCDRLNEDHFAELVASIPFSYVAKKAFFREACNSPIFEVNRSGLTENLNKMLLARCENPRVQKLWDIQHCLITRFYNWCDIFNEQDIAPDDQAHRYGFLYAPYLAILDALNAISYVNDEQKKVLLLDMFRTAYLQQESRAFFKHDPFFLSHILDWLRELGVSAAERLCPEDAEDARSLFSAALTELISKKNYAVIESMVISAKTFSDNVFNAQMALLQDSPDFRAGVVADPLLRESLRGAFGHQLIDVPSDPESKSYHVIRFALACENAVTVHGSLLEKLLQAPALSGAGGLLQRRPIAPTEG